MAHSVPIPDTQVLLRLLQFASPALPVGAYSYSEGLEYAVEKGAVTDTTSLREWLEDALMHGGVRVEAAVLVRAYDGWRARDTAAVERWNAWLTAARESEEVRLQNLEMGRALLKLLAELRPPMPCVDRLLARPCNFGIAFAIAAAHWHIPRDAAVAGYLHTWVANLISAGVKLVPLGQTAGQQLLWELQAAIEKTVQAAMELKDDDLYVANWGQALACMQHEVQYSRLFRS